MFSSIFYRSRKVSRVQGFRLLFYLLSSAFLSSGFKNTPGRQALANPGGESLGGGKEPADLFVKGG